jgi:hypothetical protein
MKRIVVFVVVLCALSFSGLCQKSDWAVVKKELIGTYTGDLKKGLANGKGTAVGPDSYTGDFKKGLPDGQGVYTDSEGNIYTGSFVNGKKDGKGELFIKNTVPNSVVTGYWENDKYIGKEKIDPYEISNRTGAVDPRIYSAGPGNKVEISIIDPVSHGYLGANIFYTGQASLRTTSGRYYYEDAVFPMEFNISYNCTNKIGTAVISNTVRIKINKPGYWVVTLKN